MNQQPVDVNVKQEGATYAQPPQYDPNQQQQAYYPPQQGYPPQQYAQQGYPPQQPVYYEPGQVQTQPQYYNPQPVVMAQPVATTTTTVVNTAASGEGKLAEEAFMFALLISFVMWFLGIGFCFSCFFFIPVMKYRNSSDPRAKQYGTYGQLGFFITLVLNIVLVVCIALPIVIAIIAVAASASRVRV